MGDDDQQRADEAGTGTGGTEHPLQRAHRFFQRAAPAIREAQDAIERAGGIEGVREKALATADAIVQRIDEVVADATAIEGTVVEPSPATEPVGIAPDADRHARNARIRRRRLHPVELGIVVAATTYGALVLQSRRDAA